MNKNYTLKRFTGDGMAVGVWLPYLVSRLLWLATTIVVQMNFSRWSATPSDGGRSLVSLWASWDSAFYLRIASEGYTLGDTDALIAFFPFYPLVMRLVTLGSRNWDVLIVAGVVISNVALAFACYWLYQLVEDEYDRATAQRTIWIMLFFPTAFYFNVVYTEALFLMFAVGAFWAARRRNWVAAALFMGVASATRVIGVFLIVPLLVEWWRQKPRQLLSKWWLLLVPYGLIGYLLFQWQTFGDPVYFLTAQQGWGRSVSTGGFFSRLSEIGNLLYAFVFEGGTIENLGGVAFELAFGLVAVALLIIGIRKLRLSYQLYILIGLAVPLSTLQLLSMPRFVLLLFPIYIVTALVLRNRYLFRLAIVVGGALQMFLFARWALGYWVA